MNRPAFAKTALLTFIVVLIVIASPCAEAQTGNVTMTYAANGTTCDVSVFIQRTGPNPWKLGTCTFGFSYDSSAMTFSSILTKGVWDAATSASYGALLSVSYANASGLTRSIETEYLGSASGPPTDIPISPALVGTLRFTVKKPQANSSLAWDVNATAITDSAGTSGNLTGVTLTPPTNGPLPIQLTTFVALVAGAHQASLNWTTLSETNNYGFEVQKSVDRTSGFQSINGLFVQGNGTTTIRHDYSYVDKAYNPGTSFYRLKQIDLTGAFHFTDAIQATAANGIVPNALPTEYSLGQNYPNPFNPTTVIEYTLPKDANVLLEVYNVLGQKVMTLVEEAKPAGYYSVKLDGRSLASGLYFYRLVAGQQTFLRKLLLLK